MAKQKPPAAEQLYPLKLGQTCSEDATSRFYSLRYEFKPASIDTCKRGSLHSNSENKVTVECFNNQPGKPKVASEGTVGDHKEWDHVLFFDGKSFRLERLHRVMKSLQYIWMPEESSSVANASAQKDTAAGVDPKSSQDGSNDNNHVERIPSLLVTDKSFKKPAGPMVQNEKIEVEMVPMTSKPNPRGTRKASKKTPAEPKVPEGKKRATFPVLQPASPFYRKREREPSPVNIDIDDEVEETSPSKKANVEDEEIVVEEIEEEVSDYEEVDVEEEEIEVEEVVEEIEEKVGDYKKALDVEDEEIEVEEVVEEIEEEVSDYEIVYIDISKDKDGDKDWVDQIAATLRAQVGQSDEAQASASESRSESSSNESASSDSYNGSDEDSDSDSRDDEDTASSDCDDI